MQANPETLRSGANGATSAHEIFALSDEQILEIEPEPSQAATVGQPFLAVRPDAQERQAASSQQTQSAYSPAPEVSEPLDAKTAQAGVPVLLEPPAWLAAEMKDPWIGEDARELWDGVVQARNEAAAYRAAIATPEDARALKELYPGGLNEARAAAERARTLDEFDRAFFGTMGGAPSGTPEQISAARAQLAQQLLQQDPAAFREMVQLGLQILEGVNVAPPFRTASASAQASTLLQPRSVHEDAGLKTGATQALASDMGATLKSPETSSPRVSPGGASPAPTAQPTGAAERQVAEYAAFERAANEDLERSVGGTITRTIEQALPNLSRNVQPASVGARRASSAPGSELVLLNDRLAAAVRQDVESALKSDRQLGDQIAQILSARRFDDATRAQVVRLIGDRAQQLVPGAARRVISEWTQTTLAAHHGRSSRADAVNARRELTPAVSVRANPGGAASSNRREILRLADSAQSDRRVLSQRSVDYRKLSDEQILDL